MTSGLWLSVDPMADKYTSINPYAYCAWKPVKLVDPDGRTLYIPNEEDDNHALTRNSLLSMLKGKYQQYVTFGKDGELSFSGK